LGYKNASLFLSFRILEIDDSSKSIASLVVLLRQSTLEPVYQPYTSLLSAPTLNFKLLVSDPILLDLGDTYTMSTTATTTALEMVPLRQRHAPYSSSLASPPSYTTIDKSRFEPTNPFETASILDSRASLLTTQTNDTMTAFPTSLPNRAFTPTRVLQIVQHGHSPLAFPLLSKILDTPIYTLPSPSTPSTEMPEQPTYISIRPHRQSGSCFLVRAGDERENARKLSATSYRFGCVGRDPVVRIANGVGGSTEAILADGREILDTPAPAPASDDEDKEANDIFNGLGGTAFTFKTSFLSRHCTFTYLGASYIWRYSTKEEKRAIEREPTSWNGCDCLLILERVWEETEEDWKGKGKTRVVERKEMVARFVRGEGTRTPGSKKSFSGNGGRLEMCLPVKERVSRPSSSRRASKHSIRSIQSVKDNNPFADPRVETQSIASHASSHNQTAITNNPNTDQQDELEILILTTLLAMLKREIDRMRNWQIAAISMLFPHNALADYLVLQAILAHRRRVACYKSGQPGGSCKRPSTWFGRGNGEGQ
jgi:hypothetical protein